MKQREKTAATTRRQARGNVPGFLGMAEMAALSGKPYRTPGLPSVWHDVLDAEGRPLYWRREHSGYEVHPAHGAFNAQLDGLSLGNWPTLTHALVACRDHMHALTKSTACADSHAADNVRPLQTTSPKTNTDGAGSADVVRNPPQCRYNDMSASGAEVG